MTALKNVLFAQVVTFRCYMLIIGIIIVIVIILPAIIAICNIHKKPYRTSLQYVPTVIHRYESKTVQEVHLQSIHLL